VRQEFVKGYLKSRSAANRRNQQNTARQGAGPTRGSTPQEDPKSRVQVFSRPERAVSHEGRGAYEANILPTIGDCFASCAASVLEIPISELPSIPLPVEEWKAASGHLPVVGVRRRIPSLRGLSADISQTIC